MVAFEKLPEKPRPLSRSEERLQRLCGKTFLSLWSFPGVHKDQGTGGNRPGGKELCDLLVVFANNIIIFSDKTCEFPSTGDLKTDWKRWYNRAIRDSAKQLRGAERWIRSYPDRIFIDAKCEFPFPFSLPNPDKAQFHRIIVAGGASERCRRELGGTGSLMLAYGPPKAGNDVADPFTVGIPDDKKGFIHVFDDFTLRIVLQTLDTITDFVWYLAAKERFVTSNKFVLATGEEELLANYLTRTGPDGRHAFVFPKNFTGIFVDQGHWADFEINPQRLAQIEADRVSYSWDRLVEKFTYYATRGETQYRNYSAISDFELGIRFMAREPRVKRRMLAKALLEVMAKPRVGVERATRVLYPTFAGDPFYVFLSLLPPQGSTEPEYRTVRRNILEWLCMVVRARWTEAEDIVGIATTPLDSEDISEDLVYLNGRAWSDEQQDHAVKLQDEFRLLTNLSFLASSEKEYPDLQGKVGPARKHPHKIGRNDLCLCRSGRKFKRCCGR